MKVTVAQPTINKKGQGKSSAIKTTIGLVLMASFISFVAAWVIKGETAKHGGVRSAITQWAYEHGNKAVTGESSYLNLLKAPYYILKADDLPQLVLDIKFKNFQKIQEKREQAFERGLLITGKDDFVAAKIRLDGKTTRVKVRLKGDLLDHLEGDKWSFRVKVKGKGHVFGMRVFSLQNPLVRGFQGGPLFYATLKRYGVLAPGYKLVNLIVNGSNLGVMSLEEHFSKELLEANGRKESVIIRFDESLVWQASDGRKHAGLGGHFDNFHVAPIDSFGTKKIAKSEKLTQDYEVAVGLLRAFEAGSMAPSEVFDVELMARYMAVSELWGSWHSFSWRNLRFYFNPITSRLEPVGFDPDIQSRNPPGINTARREQITSVMRGMLLDDPEMFTAFKKAIDMISNDMKNGSFMAKLEKLQDDLLQKLRGEYFFLQPFDKSELEQRVALLERYSKADMDELYQISYSYPKLIQAYEIDEPDEACIELANITPSVVEILSIRWVDKKDENKTIDIEMKANQVFPLVLSATPTLSKPVSRKVYFAKDKNPGKDYRLEVLAKVSGAQEIMKINVQPYFPALKNNPVPKSSLQQQALIHKNYLQTDASTGTMTIKPGYWMIRETIIVPENTVLKMGVETTLNFARNTGIISHGHLQFDGEETKKIILQGMNGDDWQGVVVLNAKEKSVLSHVVIKETKGTHIPGWSLTGGVTFYKSDVFIKDSLIADSRGEDALNIVHSNFTLENVTIKNTASDAFDADFSTGTVIGGLYEDVGLAGGGDAIDVSGSEVTVKGTRFVNVDDKSISVGERSHIRATGLDINGTGTGAASKDASVLELSSSRIRNARVAGLMAYIKKPEYGPGRITAFEVDFGRDFEVARAQKGSVITIDKEEIDTIDIDVTDMYKTVMKKGLR